MAEKPFKDREEAKKWLRTCGMWCAICEGLAFLLALVGVIWEVFEIDFGLETMSWYLLAIFFAIIAIAPHIHVAEIRHLLGIESENKK